MVSAARLNEVTLQSSSTVKTPSEMLSRMMEKGWAGSGSRRAGRERPIASAS
jgi:hypothetical protein